MRTYAIFSELDLVLLIVNYVQFKSHLKRGIIKVV